MLSDNRSADKHEEKHISSLFVQCLPKHTMSVIEALNPSLEVYHYEAGKGKIILVAETNNLNEINLHITAIHDLSGVVNVAQIYHHVENDHSLNEDLL